MQISVQPLSYEDKLNERKLSDIELVVVHCTELPDLNTARKYGEKIHYQSGTGNSGHYYIDRDGQIYQWVKPERVAHHVKGHNQQSIGIELVNIGRHPNWHHSNHQSPTEAYPDTLIQSLIQLINHLHQDIPTLKHIAGHEDLDQTLIAAVDNSKLQVRRKIDPGPLFPWEKVMNNIPLINIGSTAKNYE
ncbi:MAG: N-acetylmuramoyl-L-alanine amidase [Marinicella sp.]|nr:N-acetylmuramoyl-L-alanine amidase [Xanthomonadales bacterium]